MPTIVQTVPLGAGQLVVNGRAYEAQNVVYQSSAELIEHKKGMPAKVVKRTFATVGGRLTATVLAEVGDLSTLLGIPSGTDMPEYAVGFSSNDPQGPSVSISMTANIMPTSALKFSQSGWAMVDVELVSVGSSVPQIS